MVCRRNRTIDMGTSEIQGELWGRAPSEWVELQESFSIPLWESMLDATGVGSGSNVLDAGCGAGGASVLVDRRGAFATGLDASAGLIELAKRRVPKADFRVGDLEDLPFNDKEFDAVIAASSIQYAGDPLAAVREISRVTAPGGRVAVGLFSTPEKVDYRVVFEAIRDALPEPSEGEGPFALSSPGKLESLIEATALTLVGDGDADCPFNFTDMDEFWRGCISAGPAQAALEVVTAEDLRRRLESAAAPYRQPDGSIRFEVAFRYVIATMR